MTYIITCNVDTKIITWLSFKSGLCFWRPIEDIKKASRLHWIPLDIHIERTTNMVLQVLKNFAGKTSIHGLGFVVDHRLSVFTRATWALIFTAAIIWASIQLQFSVTCKLRVKFLRITLIRKNLLLASIIMKAKVFRQSQNFSLFGLCL